MVQLRVPTIIRRARAGRAALAGPTRRGAAKMGEPSERRPGTEPC